MLGLIDEDAVAMREYLEADIARDGDEVMPASSATCNASAVGAAKYEKRLYA